MSLIQGEIVIEDSASPFLKYMIETKPDWMRKALKSAGWWMQKEIKAGIRSGAPGGSPYAPFIPPGIRSKIERAFGNRGKRNYQPLGKLSNAVGYQYIEADSAVAVGWLSASAVRLGELIEKGSSKTVTEKMRRYFWAAGVFLNKSSIDIPARKTFGPMQKVLEPQVSTYIENKILSYMENGAARSGTTRRRYRVMS